MTMETPLIAQRDSAPHKRQEVSVPEGIRVLEPPVHTRLIPAIQFDFLKEGAAQHVRAKGNVRGSHQSSEWKIAKHV